MKLIKLVFIFFLMAVAAQAQVSLVKQNYSRYMRNVGGKEEFRRICKQEMVYPGEALKKNAKGKVILRFKVKKDGTLDNIRVKQSAGKDLDAEALRLIRLLQWQPAIYRGSMTDAFAEYIITFNPKKYKRICARRGYDDIALPPGTDTSLTVYNTTEQPPVFIEGNDKLNAFISENLVYPHDALRNNIGGNVLVSFIVEPSGFVTNLKVEKPVGAGCDQEALRIIGLTRWKPAMHEGKVVRSRMLLPIGFRTQHSVRDTERYEQKTY